MAERLSMTGESNLSPEGSTAVLTPPNEAEPLSPEDVIKEAESIISSQQTDTSITPENFTTTGSQQPPDTGGAEGNQQEEGRQGQEADGGQPPDGDNGGNNEGEGGGRGPENIWGPEFRKRGISIAMEIFELERLDYEEKYDVQRHPPNDSVHFSTRLDELYVQWKGWVALNRTRSFQRKPFDPSVFTTTESAAQQIAQIPEQNLIGLESPRNLLETYNKLRIDPEATEEGVREIENQLSRYFLEAKRLGLLTGIDSSLISIYVDIMRGAYPRESREGREVTRRLSAAEIWARVEESREAISKLGGRSFQALRRSNRGRAQEITPQLEGIWDVYTDLAIDRFALLLNGGGLVDIVTIEGEFNFEPKNLQEMRQAIPTDEQLRERAGGNADEFKRLSREREEWFNRNRESIDALDREIYREMSDDEELYWRPTWSSYFEVTARTPAQFDIAVETFTQWIRSGLTKSPQELFQRVNGFIDALTTAGQRERARVPSAHIKIKNLELRGLISVLGGNHANEHYNNPYLKQFLEYGAQDEGPERYNTLGKANRAKVAAILWKLDNDPRFELFFSPHGSRGQLMEERNPIEMEQLQEQIMNMLILEMMAVEIKGYHPDDPEKRLNDRFLEENISEVVNFKPDEEFKNLFEGFEQDDQDFIYQSFLKKQTWLNRAQELQLQINEGLLPADLDEEDRMIYGLLMQGKLDFKEAEAQYFQRLTRVRRMQQEYLEGRFDSDALQGDERRMYEEARNAVTLAYEMYGVMGEKAKRGGGVLIVDKKNSDGTPMLNKEGQPIVEYLPVNQGEKVSHFAENWVKATYGCSGDDLDARIQEKLKLERKEAGEAALRNPNLTAEQRSRIEAWMNPKGLFADELQRRVDQARRMSIWAMKTYGFGAKLWDFTLLRNGRAIDINTLGYYKDYYGNPYGIDNNADNDVQRYRYCVPENPNALGYNRAGKEVILVFDNQGKPITGALTGLEFDTATGEALIYDSRTENYEVEIEGEKIAKTRELIRFDNLNKNTKADRMLLKTPDPYYPNGKPVDFDTAIHHIYSRWTAHPYWGYQEEDTGLFLDSKVFEAAKRIRSGQSRPEDEEPHATQLLIADLTLERVAHFPHKESREDKIVLAAVEESYQSHWKIRDELLQAFLPDGPDVESSRTAYVLQDFGGSTKEWLNFNFEAARWANMKVRRARSLTAILPLHFAAMSEMWGAPRGALDVLRMMNYGELGERGSYRMVGQFALEKWINQTGGAQDVYDALFGYVSEQEKRSKEGYGEKPNNDADALQKLHDRITGIVFNLKQYFKDKDKAKLPLSSEHIDNQYVNNVREAMGRPEISQHRIRVLETDMRGERAPLWLMGIDIWQRNADGSIRVENGQRVYNQAIDGNRDTGSSRHSGTIWFWRMVRWQRSDKPGEGQALYPDSKKYFEWMDMPTIISMIFSIGKDNLLDRTKFVSRWNWLLGKIVR